MTPFVHALRPSPTSRHELQAWLLAERKAKVSIGCLWTRLKFLKLPLKKSRSEPPNRTGQMWPKRVTSGVPARAS